MDLADTDKSAVGKLCFEEKTFNSLIIMLVFFFFQLNRATVHNPITGQLEFAHYRISKKYVSTRKESIKLATKSFVIKNCIILCKRKANNYNSGVVLFLNKCISVAND